MANTLNQEATFRHSSLPDPSSCIRLLEVLDIVADDDNNTKFNIKCEISPWPVESCPPYIAISYTWGNPALLTFITINGRQMQVRHNCEYVLRQAWSYSGGDRLYIWVDAICIDQKNIEEKSDQIPSRSWTRLPFSGLSWEG